MEELKQRTRAKSYRVRRYITRQNKIEQDQQFTINQIVFFWSFTEDGVEQTVGFTCCGVHLLWIKKELLRLRWLKKSWDLYWHSKTYQSQKTIFNIMLQICPNGNWLAQMEFKDFGWNISPTFIKVQVPTQIVEGRTTLVMKDKLIGPVVGNYCPIAFLINFGNF